MNDADNATIDREVRDLVDYLVFTEEAPFATPVQGVSPFTATFAAAGPRDRKGRSLASMGACARCCASAIPSPWKSCARRRTTCPRAGKRGVASAFRRLFTRLRPPPQ